jgi:ribosomal protein S12 methylthiotransferase
MPESVRSRRSLPVLPQAGPLPGSGPETRASATAGAPRIGVVTLGCDKNTVDTERLLARLAGAGARVQEGIGGADVVVVNTCGFIDTAREESVDAILAAVRLKEEGRVKAVVALGCLVQRHGDELRAELPEVDLFLGLAEAERLVPELRERGLLDRGVPLMERPLRILSTRTRHTSFLKISEGCDHGCAFCAIPLMRGKHRSTPIGELVREARELEAAGVVELNVVSQDTTWYGRDWRGGMPAGNRESGDYFLGRDFARLAGPRPAPVTAAARPRRARAPAQSGGAAATPAARRGMLPELLEALLRETTIPWLRLFYMYPSGITRELVQRIAAEDRILPYLDMPIQHGADRVLERMRRPERRSTILERVGWLRDAIPGLVLRSTVIVGFPGETEADFEALLELLEEVRFDRLGAFSYSAEEGTPAATLPDPVPDGIKRERLERLQDVQRTISLERNEAQVGREATVLVDGVDEGGWTGRTAGQALDIDGLVRLAGAGAGAQPAAGSFVHARITGADEQELTAVILGRG